MSEPRPATGWVLRRRQTVPADNLRRDRAEPLGAGRAEPCPAKAIALRNMSVPGSRSRVLARTRPGPRPGLRPFRAELIPRTNSGTPLPPGHRDQGRLRHVARVSRCRPCAASPAPVPSARPGSRSPGRSGRSGAGEHLAAPRRASSAPAHRRSGSGAAAFPGRKALHGPPSARVSGPIPGMRQSRRVRAVEVLFPVAAMAMTSAEQAGPTALPERRAKGASSRKIRIGRPSGCRRHGRTSAATWPNDASHRRPHCVQVPGPSLHELLELQARQASRKATLPVPVAPRSRKTCFGCSTPMTETSCFIQTS